MDYQSSPQPGISVVGGGSSGLVARRSNADLDRMADENRKKTEALNQQEHIIRLAGHIQTSWQAARQAKFPIEERLLKCMRQRDGKYDPDVLSRLQEQEETNDPIFMMLTNIKCRAAKSWIKDIMLPASERPWSIDPTPVPSMPPDIKETAKKELMRDYLIFTANKFGIHPSQLQPEMINQDELFMAGQKLHKELMGILEQKAKDDAERLADEIDDDLKEGGWAEALEDTIEDVIDFPSGFIAGPILRKRKKLEWQKQGGASKAVVVTKFVREWDSVSPFDIYPSPGAKTLQDGDLIHILRWSGSDLMALAGVEGFSQEAIEHVVALNPGGLRLHLTYDTEIADLEDRGYDRNDTVARFDIIKYMGRVQGNILLEWGMDTKEVENPAEFYNVVAYLVGGTVISARLNPHPLGNRRYYSASFAKKVRSIWGKSVPELMADVQKICNACARAIVRNMGMASGPQVWMLADRMASGAVVDQMHPWKLWQFTSKKAGTSGSEVPMGFFQADPIIDVLIKLYDYFYKQASEVTGIPAYVYGNEAVGGAGKTASGLSMLMNAASKGLKEVAKHIDSGIIKKTVYEDWVHIMLNEPEKAGGDIEIVARASEYLIQQEQLSIRRMEFLQATNNQWDQQIIGNDGRA